MTSERVIQAHLDRERARREAAAREPQEAATPQQRLMRAAETGRLEAIVAAAQPAEPPKMVSPEEREAELRRAGQGTGKGRDKPKAKRKAAPKPAPKEPERPLTPNEQYIAEHCQWRRRGPGDYRARVPYGRCLTEYDPLTGEIIGDGYDHSGEEDEEW